jgi:phage terminase large subunit
VFYGLDFGFTNSPSALTKCSIRGSDLFIQYLVYEPTVDANILGEKISHFVTKKDEIWCDSAQPGMIISLDDQGYKAYGVKKFPGSILFRIDLAKRYKLNIVRSAPAEKEFNNYAYRTINGIQLNEPIDDFNHGMDSWMYGLQMSI